MIARLRAMSYPAQLVWTTLLLLVVHWGLVEWVARSGTMEAIMALHGTRLDFAVVLWTLMARLGVYFLLPALWTGWLVLCLVRRLGRDRITP